MSDKLDHHKFMDRCIELANRAMLKGNPPVGALLLKNGDIIAEGIEAGKSRGDVTAHAEIEVFKNAKIKGYNEFTDCTLYSTHEPCVMCSYVIRYYKVQKVVIGLEVEELGGFSSKYALLSDDQISKWKETPLLIKGIERERIEELNEIYRILKKRG